MAVICDLRAVDSFVARSFALRALAIDCAASDGTCSGAGLEKAR